MDTIFDQNPSLDLCFKTSDGKYFFNDNDAHNYAKTLEDKGVEKLERSARLTNTPEPIELEETTEDSPVVGSVLEVEKTTKKAK